MKEEKVYFKNSDGLKLCGIFTYPKSQTKTCIVLCHGITVDKDEDGGFVELSKALSNSGFAVFRFDFRGHGESDGSSIDLTVIGEEDDLSSAVQFLRDKGYERFGVLGASFGAGPATLYVAEHKDVVKAFVLWYPLIDYSNILNPILPWPKKYFNESAMKRLEKVGYIEIGSGHFKIGNKLIEEMRSLEPWKGLKNIRIPIMFVHGSKDTYIPYEDSVKYSKLFNAKLETVKGADHGLHNGWKGEMTDRITVDWFVKWLK